MIEIKKDNGNIAIDKVGYLVKSSLMQEKREENDMGNLIDNKNKSKGTEPFSKEEFLKGFNSVSSGEMLRYTLDTHTTPNGKSVEETLKSDIYELIRMISEEGMSITPIKERPRSMANQRMKKSYTSAHIIRREDDLGILISLIQNYDIHFILFNLKDSYVQKYVKIDEKLL